jgi:predicted nucleotidyltransferase component of viral defense system
MFSEDYARQTELMLRCIPAVAAQDCFALKGGSAINFFVRDMPRLSVDIDLTYCRLADRDTSLSEIDQGLTAIAGAVRETIDGAEVTPRVVQGRVIRLVVSAGGTQIKIEPNLVLRGSVGNTVEMDLCNAARERFGLFASVHCLPVCDLYGGKLCAALDRQHPRDLFDVKLLLDDAGITAEIRRAFVVYLASHNRPMEELLAPRQQDIRDSYDGEFQGMTGLQVSAEALMTVQASLAPALVDALNAAERQFLLSMKSGDPDWSVLGIEDLERMPALQWKLINIRKMDAGKRDEQFGLLQDLLGTG